MTLGVAVVDVPSVNARAHSQEIMETATAYTVTGHELPVIL
jgi:hypothetical protein